MKRRVAVIRETRNTEGHCLLSGLNDEMQRHGIENDIYTSAASG